PEAVDFNVVRKVISGVERQHAESRLRPSVSTSHIRIILRAANVIEQSAGEAGRKPAIEPKCAKVLIAMMRCFVLAVERRHVKVTAIVGPTVIQASGVSKPATRVVLASS